MINYYWPELILSGDFIYFLKTPYVRIKRKIRGKDKFETIKNFIHYNILRSGKKKI